MVSRPASSTTSICTGPVRPENGSALRDVAYTRTQPVAGTVARRTQQGMPQTRLSIRSERCIEEVKGLKDTLIRCSNNQQLTSHAGCRRLTFGLRRTIAGFDESGAVASTADRATNSSSASIWRTAPPAAAVAASQATRAARTRTPSAQTRPTDRSISGAPDAGSLKRSRGQKGPPPSAPRMPSRTPIRRDQWRA